MAQRTNIVASAVPKHEIGIASSILALVRNIAGAFGVSIFGTLLTRSIESRIFSISESSTIRATDLIQYQQGVGLIELKAQISSYGTVFLAAAFVLLFGALISLTIKTKKIDPNVHVFVE